MVESTRVQGPKTRPPPVKDISRRQRLRLNMRRRPKPTRSSARRRTWASQASQQHPGPEILMTAALYQPKRQERLILRPIGEEIMGVQRTTPLDIARQSILATFRPWHGSLQI